MKKAPEKLGSFAATAICANDILSSVLYVAGFAVTIAGVFAPLVLLTIGGVLFLYKGVYREVVEALPVNGGSYNALLNGTSKSIAATAAVLTILSYIATTVISGKTAVAYLHTIIPVPIIATTILILGIFAALIIGGVKNSSKVAMIIFTLHIGTLIAFVILGFRYMFTHSLQWTLNVHYTAELIQAQSLPVVFFLGFAASLLGVSGFESSADFIEQQRPRVFNKTLRNMLIGVVIFNPLVALLALNIDTLPAANAYKDFLLAHEAQIIGGSVFQIIVVLDSFLVLCGAVLASFVGVSGLVSRLAVDECVPIRLAKKNKHGSFTAIALVFFLLCTSILLSTRGNLVSLAGVYAISFLSVMSMFAMANIILKVTRPELKRTYHFPTAGVVAAFVFTAVGVVGTIVLDVHNVVYFLFYFLPMFIIVMGYVYRQYLMAGLVSVTQSNRRLHQLAQRLFRSVVRGRYVVCIRGSQRLFTTLRYIHNNEAGRRVTIVHCRDRAGDNRLGWKALQALVPALAQAGVYPQLQLELVEEVGEFGPAMVDYLAKKYRVPHNRIFIGSIHSSHHFDYADLGGVRIIA